MIGPGFAAGIGGRMLMWFVAILLGVGFVALVIGYETALWRECIADHPWWYCLRILGR